jgi:hypothetical protein
MSNLNKLPRITWGSAFSSSLNFGYPLDQWKSYSEPMEGSQFLQVESGDEDAWIISTNYVLEGQVRWVPTTSTVTPLASGWDGVTGWRTFLEWARAKNQFRFFPDKNSGTYYTCYLVEPMQGGHDLEPDGTRSFPIKIRNTSSPFDGY